MGRILLSICAVVVALGLSGSSPPQGNAGIQTSHADQPQGKTGAPAPPAKADDPERLYATCREGENNRSSDLCAQWNAVDAARISATWTRWTGIATWAGLIVGALTMGAAILAAIFTWSTAHTAKKALTRLERPFLYLAPAAGSGFVEQPLPGAKGWKFSVQLTATNYGRSPAVIREHRVIVEHWELVLRPQKSQWLKDQIAKAQADPDPKHRAASEAFFAERDANQNAAMEKFENPERQLVVVGPGEPKALDGFTAQWGINDPASFHDMVSGARPIIVTARTLYDDVFGDSFERVARWRFVYSGRLFIEDGGSANNYERRLSSRR